MAKNVLQMPTIQSECLLLEQIRARGSKFKCDGTHRAFLPGFQFWAPMWAGEALVSVEFQGEPGFNISGYGFKDKN